MQPPARSLGLFCVISTFIYLTCWTQVSVCSLGSVSDGASVLEEAPETPVKTLPSSAIPPSSSPSPPVHIEEEADAHDDDEDDDRIIDPGGDEDEADLDRSASNTSDHDHHRQEPEVKHIHHFPEYKGDEDDDEEDTAANELVLSPEEVVVSPSTSTTLPAATAGIAAKSNGSKKKKKRIKKPKTDDGSGGSISPSTYPASAFDERYVFTKPFYNVTIAENAVGKSYAVVKIPSSSAHGDLNLDLSPYEKMGIYISDPALVVRFKIVGGDERGLFKAEGRHIGDFWFLRIRTRASEIAVLNREFLDHFHLKVRATITSARSDKVRYKARCEIFVEVEDSNDLNPLFYPTSYEVDVPEDTPVDSSLVKVSAFDPDIGLNGEIYYSLDFSGSDENAADFAVHPTTGVISLLRPLRRRTPSSSSSDNNNLNSKLPTTNRIRPPMSSGSSVRSPPPPPPPTPLQRQRQLIVWAVDRASIKRGGSSSGGGHASLALMSGRATVNINVIPVNMHKPQITPKRDVSSSPSSSSAATSSEETAAASEELYNHNRFVVASVQVSDEDGEDSVFGRICSVSIIDGNDLDLFVITNSSSVRGEFNIELKAPSASGSSPSASSGSLVRNYLEHSQKSKRDSSSGGAIKLKSFFRTQGPEFVFNLTLKAADCGGRWTSRAVDVFFSPFSAKHSFSLDSSSPLDALFKSLLKPTFGKHRYTTDIHEVALVGSQVLRLTANIPIVSSNRSHFSNEFKHSKKSQASISLLRYSITDGNYEDTFRITSSGIVVTNAKLDHERRKEFVLTVTAQLNFDFFSHWGSATCQVHVRLLDDNDQDPVFQAAQQNYQHSGSLINQYSGRHEDGPSSINITFDENRPVDTQLIKVSAIDLDSGENGRVTYSLANHHDHGQVPFQIDERTGEIRPSEVLDFETRPHVYRLIVRATDAGAPFRRRTEVVINVSLQDINDHRPLFERKDCTAYVPRKTQPQTEIVTLSAIDFDAGSVVQYMLTGANSSGCFDLNRESGVLSLTCNLESARAGKALITETSVYISATDGEYFADAMPVRVVITEEDGTPAGLSSTERASSSSSKKRGVASGILVECADVQGIKQKIKKYMLRDESHESSSNDIESGPGDDHAGDKRLRSSIQSESNRAKPEFDSSNPTEVFIRENIGLGARIIRLFVTDSDAAFNGMLVYSLNLHEAEDDDATKPFPFDIDTFSGEIFAADAVDREKQSKYRLNVTACDLGSRPQQFCASHLLKVYVDDDNDDVPKFKPSAVMHLSVREDAKLGSTVTRLQAVDSDAGNNAVLKYTLLNHRKEFAVDSKSGVLTVADELDREKTAEYKLYVSVSDSGSPSKSSTATVYVAIKDVNDNFPKFKEVTYLANVREDFPVGALVTRMRAFDLDEGRAARIRYYIRAGNEDGKFAIDEDFGNVRIKKPLDFEKRPNYNLTIAAKDEGEPSLSSLASLLINVQDIDENKYQPKFPDTFATGSVKENLPPGTYVMTVLATDDDSPYGHDRSLNPSVAYQIVDGDGLGKFTLDPDGKIYTRTVLDREADGSYWLTIVAKDRSAVPRTSHVHVFIEVLDENDCAPTTLEPFYRVAVLENASTSSDVLQLIARDADLHVDDYQFNYRIVNDGSPFKIVKTTGLIQTKEALDRETQRQYILDVEVSEIAGSNGHTLMSRTPVIIDIMGVNDNSPQLLETIIRCRAYNTLPSRMPICQLTAYDLDDIGNDSARPSSPLFEITGGNEYNLFRLNKTTGEIFYQSDEAASVLQNSYELSVSVSDQGSPPKSTEALVMIKIAEPNQKGENGTNLPPEFTGTVDTDFVVRENEAIGHVITRFEVYDDDFDQVTTHLVAGNSDGTFAMDDGALKVARLIDYEERRKYYLTVAVTDGLDYSYLNITINVIDLPDNVPQFVSDVYSVDVPENVTTGSVILDLKIIDPDTVKGHVFSIYTSGSPRTLDLFEVDSSTGRLLVKEPLDHELVSRHVLVVEVSDFGSNSASAGARGRRKSDTAAPTMSPSLSPLASHRAFAQITVNVLDVNEEAPHFTSSFYSATVPETVALGTSVMQVIATDADSGLNSKVSYSLISGNTGGAFKIEPELGYIYVAKALSVRLQAEYHLVVKATDHGKPALANYSNVQLSITVPDHVPPKFEKSTYVFQVTEDAKVGEIVAGGIKAASKQSVAYEIVATVAGEQDDRRHFAINQNNGEISIRWPLDYERSRRHEFKVKASNLAGANASATVLINVLDCNDNSPHWNQSIFRGHIAENARPGSVVLSEDNLSLLVKALDLDSKENGLVEYAINEEYAREFFAIDAVTGAISLMRAIDYEPFSEMNFTVSVTDLGVPARRAETSATVSITVDDVPDPEPEPPVVVVEEKPPEVEPVVVSEKPVEVTNSSTERPVDSSKLVVVKSESSSLNVTTGQHNSSKGDSSDKKKGGELDTDGVSSNKASHSVESTSEHRPASNETHSEQSTSERPKAQLFYCHPVNPCANNGLCTEIPMGFSCKCKSGFHGLNCESDIDECSLASSLCPPHSTCINLPGTYHCVPHYHITAGNGSEFPCVDDHMGDYIPRVVSTSFATLNIGLDELILILLVLFVLFVTCCCMSICWKYKGKSRRSRTPNNAYRGNVGANEFLLLKNNAKNNDMNVNLKRFSKLSNLEPTPIGPLNSDQVHPQPKAAAHRMAHARPMSVHENMNNFDNIRRYNSVHEDLEGAAVASAQAAMSTRETTVPQDLFSHNFKKVTSPIVVSVSPQLSEVVTTQSTVSPPSSHTPEDKIQNVCVEPKSTASSASSSRTTPQKRNSMCDADLNVFNEDQSNASNNAEGYHWDCSDWALIEEHNKPHPNILEVSVAEVRDSECNSDNSQLDLVLLHEQAQTRRRSAPIRRKTFTVSPHNAGNVQNGHRPIVSSCTNDNAQTTVSVENGNVTKADHEDGEDDVSEATALLETFDDQMNQFEFADDSLPASPVLYVSRHPTDYLVPVYCSTGDVNGSDSCSSFSNSKWKSSGDIGQSSRSVNGGGSDHKAIVCLTTDSSNDNVSLPASSLNFHKPNANNAVKTTSVAVELDHDDPGYDGDHIISDTDSVSGRQSTYV